MSQLAARSSKQILHEQWRTKIRASMLINRLRNHVLGRITLSASQVRAADILLRKVIPDLAVMQHVDGEGNAMPTGIEIIYNGQPHLRLVHDVTPKVEYVGADSPGAVS